MNSLLACDIDGVLIHYDEWAFLDFCEMNGCEVNRMMFAATHSWTKSVTKDGEKVELDDLFFDFLSTQEHLQEPVEGAKTSLLRLARYYELHAVSARARRLEAVTRRALALHCPGVRFASVELGHSESKGSVIAAAGHAVAIEDSNSEIHNILEHVTSITVIQFPSFRGRRQPVIDDPRVHRLNACNEVHRGGADRQSIWSSAWQETVLVLESLVRAVA